MKGASGKIKAKRMVVLYEGGRPSRTWVGRCTKALGAECVAIKADSVRSLSSSRILHVSHRTVFRWLHGECGPQPSHRDAIEKAVLLRNRMLKVLRKDAIPGYLMAYNEVLGGVRPLDLLTSGQADKVAADIASLEAGVFV